MSAHTSASKSPSDEQSSEFRDVADRVRDIAAKYSLNLVSYRSPELPLYSALGPAKRAEVLGQLKIFLRTMESVEASGVRLDNQERSVWHALASMGLVPPSDLFAKFGSEDVVEILDLAGVQIWRNFNFLRICSYTLEEMYCFDWKERYTRDEAMIGECIRKVGALLAGETPDLYHSNIEDHVIQETRSSDRFTLQVRHEYMARLKDRNGQLAAWLVVSRVENLGRDIATPKAAKPLWLVDSVASSLEA